MMSLQFTKKDLDKVLTDGKYVAELKDIKAEEKEIKGNKREIIKFTFKTEGKLIVEECIRYLHAENDSKLKSFLEQMTGKDIEAILEDGIDLKDLVGRKYNVLISKNKSSKTGNVFYNIDRIVREVEKNKAEIDDEFDKIFNDEK